MAETKKEKIEVEEPELARELFLRFFFDRFDIAKGFLERLDICYA